MRKWQKNSNYQSSPPSFEVIQQIDSDTINQDTIYWGNTEKLTRNDINALSVHRIATISNASGTTIISPFSIGSILAISRAWDAICNGSGSSYSQWCVYVKHNAPPASDTVWVDTANLINIGSGSVSTSIQGRSVSINNNSWTSITVILTIFA